MGTIINAANIPLSQQNTFTPDVSGAVQNYLQLMTFTRVTKTIVNFQVVETPMNTNFWGDIQQFSDQKLRMLPEGQRTQWQWWLMHCEPAVVLLPDDVVNYLGNQLRVMTKKDFTLYGYLEYTLQSDWSGSGP